MKQGVIRTIGKNTGPGVAENHDLFRAATKLEKSDKRFVINFFTFGIEKKQRNEKNPLVSIFYPGTGSDSGSALV